MCKYIVRDSPCLGNLVLLSSRGELRVAEEIGKKRGDLLVTCVTLGARNGGQFS